MRRIFLSFNLNLLKITIASQGRRRWWPLYENYLIVNWVRLQHTPIRSRSDINLAKVTLIRAGYRWCWKLGNRKTWLVVVLRVVLSQGQVNFLFFIGRRGLDWSRCGRCKLSCRRRRNSRSLMVVSIYLVGMILIKGNNVRVLVLISRVLLEPILVKSNILFTVHRWYGVIVHVFIDWAQIICYITTYDSLGPLVHSLLLLQLLLLVYFNYLWSIWGMKKLNRSIGSNL